MNKEEIIRNRKEIRELIKDGIPKKQKKSVAEKHKEKPYFFKKDVCVYRFATLEEMKDKIAEFRERDLENAAGLSLYEAKVYMNHIVFPNGKIFNSKCKELAYTKTKFGTYTVYLEGTKPTVHNVIAKCFLPNPFENSHLVHRDGNKANNSVENLEWVSSVEIYGGRGSRTKVRSGNPKPIPPHMKRIVTEEVYSGRFKESDLLDKLHTYFKGREIFFSEELEPVILHKSMYPVYKDYILYIPAQGVFYTMVLKYVTRNVMCIPKFYVIRSKTELKKAKEIFIKVLTETEEADII